MYSIIYWLICDVWTSVYKNIMVCYMIEFHMLTHALYQHYDFVVLAPLEASLLQMALIVK